MSDLAGQLDKKGLNVLNSDESTNGASIFEPAGPGLLKSDSDVDEQLLLVIPFMEGVKIRGVKLLCNDPEGYEQKEGEERSGPKTVKIFVDCPNYTFDECSEHKPAHVLELKPEHLDGQEVKLKFVKFQNVHSLTIFVEDNQGGTPVTYINSLSFVGVPIAGFNVANIKPIEK
eukprot:CAMPEP_0205822832 /NCGR_PEP_ID=MMETSP0206-20130828/14225_1 /ASSEMBLY_ACC=CAM_ASM_000279 /TAXON_ID=36767 /ORGANISM="Euplotes focardii, Strain TN1" /LENGTH=172 /DNA_ID=CAMNT_0053119443 /DNA_START=55 /DNA_END=573 /DNA_ORIENTATION=+